MRKMIVLLAVLMMSGCSERASKEASEPVVQSAMDSTGSSAAGPQTNYLAQGLENLKKADVTAAIRDFDSAIKQNPGDPQAYIILGQTYMNMQQYSRAIDTFVAATRLAPNEGQLYYLLAVNHRFAGNGKEARQYAEKSIELFREKKDEQNFKRALVFLQSLSDSDKVQP